MISVIIPVYNAEKFICKCLNSLLNQTLKDIEIIVVDDKGSDNSMQLVQELKDNTDIEGIIKVLEMQHNSGAAAARNFGLQNANGEYVAFMDSDDWCEPDMYKTLYTVALENNCDWCYGNIVKDYPNGGSIKLSQPRVSSGILTPEIRRVMLTRFVSFFTTAIYRRSFLKNNNIEFPLYRFSEDSFFVWMVVMHAQRFAAVDKVFYHYNVQPNSVTNVYDSTKYQQKIDVFTLLIKQLREKQLYDAYKEELDYMCIKKGFIIPLTICAIYSDVDFSEQMNDIFRKMEKLIPDYKKNSYLRKNLPLRLLLFTAKNNPRLFRSMMRTYSKNKREIF